MAPLLNQRSRARLGCVGIIANPMAGRDVGRPGAGTSEGTLQAKRDAIARIASGADAAGIGRLLVQEERFRISAGVIDTLSLAVSVETVSATASGNGEADTASAVAMMRAQGVDALVVLGGDDTSRCVARAWPDAPLVSVSTGINNVFACMVEPTLAGMAAGLVASGRVPIGEVARAAKVVRVRAPRFDDAIALVDVVLLRDDFVGNRMAFDPARIDRVLLTIADPASLGTSSIGGLIDLVSPDDEPGLLVTCNRGPDDRVLHVPISPGLFRDVRVCEAHRVDPDVTVLFEGPGVVALDGRRAIALMTGEAARLVVERNGPRVIDVEAALVAAARRRVFG